MDFLPEPRSYYRSIFFSTFSSIMIGDVYKKLQLKWTFCLNHDLITEPFFRDFFSIMNCDVYKKVQLKWTFVTVISMRVNSQDIRLVIDFIYEPFDS